MAEAVDYKVIGTRPIRPDGVDKVTGRAQYGADLNLPNSLYGKVLRSPHAHARIDNSDKSAAVAKAIYDRTKARLTATPMTPMRILAHLQEAAPDV